ncbi:unnamed protein product [Nezara viridula]|uniref:Uncharacterized protein n=1 Tax=Nezara viridula TaxID=85310 RepID=A0A9P0HLG7_NEZVI|nr:unnamed protein product [Nezara viridula]
MDLGCGRRIPVVPDRIPVRLFPDTFFDEGLTGYLVALCLAVVVVAVSAQFDFFGGYPGGFGAAGPRDPRDNRGPVTFPVTSGGSETSGVRIGASGYGFIPPGSRGGSKVCFAVSWFLHRGDLGSIFVPENDSSSCVLLSISPLMGNVEGKAQLSLRRNHEEGVTETVIHKLGTKEQANDALQKAKRILDASLMDAEHKVLAHMVLDQTPSKV